MGAVGMAAEVLFTAACDARAKGPRLIGYSYVWMLPIYMLLYPGFYFLLPFVGDWAWPLRGAIYAVLIMIIEGITGFALHAALGEAPWESEYRGKRWALWDLVRLDFFPAWAIGALVFERAYRLITG